MNTRDILLAFFEAENKRDWAAYRKFLSPDVVWTLHSRQTEIIRGRENYLTAMMEAYRSCDNTFVCEALHQSSDGTRVVTMLRNDLDERSCDIFEFADDCIVREDEFILD